MRRSTNRKLGGPWQVLAPIDQKSATGDGGGPSAGWDNLCYKFSD
jgi:hypothetical protein